MEAHARHRPKRTLWLATTLVGLACAPVPPVAWETEHRVVGVIMPGAIVQLGEGGIPAVALAPTPIRWPDDSAACPNTWAAAAAAADTVVAAWWSAVVGGEPVVRAAWSPNGGIDWGDPVTIGLAAPASGGCRKPAPGVAVDRSTGSVHVVFAGQVGDNSAIVITRVQIGREPRSVELSAAAGAGRAAVAASGDTVVVAYELGGVGRGTIWLAISHGSGHIPLVVGPVNDGDNAPFAPLVAIRDGQVAVAWNEARSGSDGPYVVTRVGRFAQENDSD